jgi:septum site-determining protein MinD
VIEGECRLKQALIKDKRCKGLFLLPAAQTRDKNSVNPEQMKDLITQLKEDFDYVLVDCPAGIEQGFRNSVAGADRAIVVTTPEISAIRDADRIIGLVEAAELPEPRLVINRFRSKMVARGDMMDTDDILEILAIPLVGIVPEDEEIIITSNKGAPAVYNEDSSVGESYRRIARRLTGEINIPYVALSPTGFWSNVKRWMGVPVQGAV